MRAWSVRRRMRARQRFGERWPASGTSGVTPLLLVRWPFQLPSRSEGNGSMLPLEGVTVVSLEQAVAAPFATVSSPTRCSGDQVERPGGDLPAPTTPPSTACPVTSCGQPEQGEPRRRPEDHVASGSCANRSTGPTCSCRTSRRGGCALGLALRAARAQPRLVVCDISATAVPGVPRQKAYDLLISAKPVWFHHRQRSRAGQNRISVADIAGGMYAFSGVLTALYERERTGRDRVRGVPFDALAEWMGYPKCYAVHRDHAEASEPGTLPSPLRSVHRR